MRMCILLILGLFLGFKVVGQDKKKQAYTIVKRHMLPDFNDESSGIIFFKGLIWSFNDSGGRPQLYGFNMKTDSVEQIIAVKNAVNHDWEDIAQDDHVIYIGDIGNNTGTRDSLVIYCIDKKDLAKSGNILVSARKITFTYPDYKPVHLSAQRSAFDCEAMVSLKNKLYLFTKDWINGTTTLYELPNTPGNYLAKKINKFNSRGFVTGADYLNGHLVLVGYNYFIPFVWRFTTTDLSQINEKNGIRSDLTDILTYQTEGICFWGDKILISTEKTRAPAQILELSFQ